MGMSVYLQGIWPINEGTARIGNLTRAKSRRVCRSTYMFVCQIALLFHLGDVEIFHRVSRNCDLLVVDESYQISKPSVQGL